MKHSSTIKNLRIKRSDSVEEFEAYLQAQSTFQSNLLLPNDMDEGGGIGNSVALCQFLLTWARRSICHDIRTYLKSSDAEAAERFTSRVHGLCAAYVSEKLFSTDNIDIRKSVLRSVRPRIEAMSRGNLSETSRGQSIELIFVEGAENEFHGSIYSRVPTPIELENRQQHSNCIRNYRELNRFLEKCFEKLHVLPASNKPEHEYIFGELLSELFKNTAEHAYQETDGAPLEKNLRCIRLAVTDIKRARLAEKSISSAEAKVVAQEYFKSIAAQKTRGRSREHVQFLELSIFDSGPGFANTIEGKEISNLDEARQAVVKCFRKRQSAKSSPNSGMGLPKVISLLNYLGGFIRVRTSSVEAFYGADPDYPASTDPETFVYGNLAEVAGSVVTICIPLAY